MLIEQAEKPVFALLGDTLLATPDVTGNRALVELWTGALGVAATGYVLFVLVGGVLVMGTRRCRPDTRSSRSLRVW